MFGSILRFTRTQKNLVLLAVDLSVVPVAFLLSYMIQFSTLDIGMALERSWTLLPILIAFAGCFVFALGLWQVRLKEFKEKAVSRSAALAVSMGMVSAVLADVVGEPSRGASTRSMRLCSLCFT